MKTKAGQLYIVLLLLLTIFSTKEAASQKTGRVLINEYLVWTSNACPTSTEFVELLNFGPGPVDISCYILTNGKISITLPPNTVLEPGEFYVLGGQDVLQQPCANVDSSVTVNLNWNTCNCTNAPVTGPDGFLADGTTYNEKLVLFDPNMMVIDAVGRSLPISASDGITTASIPGGCPSKSFDLDTMDIKYEILGMATGRGNSFARTIDGDCVWVKDPQQSANSTNNHVGNLTDITYAFTVVNPLDCDSTHGSVSVFVKHSDYTGVFPMKYTLAIDTNQNGKFDLQDSYNSYIDSTAPVIEIYGLPVGHFRVTVESVNGCYLKTFEFTILPCFPTLPVKLINFKYVAENPRQHKLEWTLTDIENLKTIVVEKASIYGHFKVDKLVNVPISSVGSRVFSSQVDPLSPEKYYRLKIISKNGNEFYSPVISRELSSPFKLNKYWPNPVKEQLNIELTSSETKKVRYIIYNVAGGKACEGTLQLTTGLNSSSLPVNYLVPGIYQLQIPDLVTPAEPISFKFVKH